LDQAENITKNPFFFVEVIVDIENPLLISDAVQALNPLASPLAPPPLMWGRESDGVGKNIIVRASVAGSGSKRIGPRGGSGRDGGGAEGAGEGATGAGRWRTPQWAVGANGSNGSASGGDVGHRSRREALTAGARSGVGGWVACGVLSTSFARHLHWEWDHQ